MSRRAVVLGAAGQLGVELVRELQDRGYSVTAWERSQLDITDPAAVTGALAAAAPQVAFNAAAYNKVDVAESEPQAALAVNAVAVRNLTLACRQLNARLVHFSTDYVFDGEAAVAYAEGDATHPLGAYGVSKLAGELYAQAYWDQVLIVRTCGVFGPAGLKTARGNFLETMLRLAAGPNPVRVIEDYIASPTYAPFLAARAIDLAQRDLAGLFHIGGGAPVSWFQFAKTIFDAAGVSPVLLPMKGSEYQAPARRPRYSALSNAKMERAGLEPVPPLREAVEQYLAERSRMTSA